MSGTNSERKKIVGAHDLAVEAADVPAVQHHHSADVKEEQLDEADEIGHGVWEVEVEDIARLAQDLVEADEDAEVGDDAVVLKHAQDAGDDGTADNHPAKCQTHHERQVDHAIVARQTLIADLEVVEVGCAVAAYRALVAHGACADVHCCVVVEEQRWARLKLVRAGTAMRRPRGRRGAEECPAALELRLTHDFAVQARGTDGTLVRRDAG